VKNPSLPYPIRSLGFIFARLIPVALSALLFSLPHLAAAEGPKDLPNLAGLMVGQVWPAGQIGQNVDGTVAPGIFYEYEASDVFSLNAQGVFANFNSGAVKVNSANLGIKAHLVYYDKLAPYVVVGAGLYFVNEQLSAPVETASKSLFGMQLGAGADLDISDRFLVGLELDIHTLFNGTAITASTRSVQISGRWTGFFLRGGVRF
jgi:opacity protein-like surface antigen